MAAAPARARGRVRSQSLSSPRRRGKPGQEGERRGDEECAHHQGRGHGGRAQTAAPGKRGRRGFPPGAGQPPPGRRMERKFVDPRPRSAMVRRATVATGAANGSGARRAVARRRRSRLGRRSRRRPLRFWPPAPSSVAPGSRRGGSGPRRSRRRRWLRTWRGPVREARAKKRRRGHPAGRALPDEKEQDEGPRQTGEDHGLEPGVAPRSRAGPSPGARRTHPGKSMGAGARPPARERSPVPARPGKSASRGMPRGAPHPGAPLPPPRGRGGKGRASPRPAWTGGRSPQAKGETAKDVGGHHEAHEAGQAATPAGP